MNFSTKAFWVNMHDLPISCLNAKMGNHIGNTIGMFKACDVDEDGYRRGTTLPVLIEMKLENPILRGRFINVEG